MYAGVIRRQQAKLEKDPESHKKTALPESESDDKMLLQVISAPKRRGHRKSVRKTKHQIFLQQKKSNRERNND
jgi:hypothetical protein